MKRKLNHKFVLGCTDTETVMLDFDNTTFKTVKYWAFRTMRWFKLEGFIILESSENHYHVVFNREVSWSENMRIVAWVSLLSNNPMLQKWLIMQCIKEGSTLRISSKMGKPGPKIVFRYGKRDKEIRDFLSYRKIVKNIDRELRTRQKETFTRHARDARLHRASISKPALRLYGGRNGQK